MLTKTLTAISAIDCIEKYSQQVDVVQLPAFGSSSRFRNSPLLVRGMLEELAHDKVQATVSVRGGALVWTFVLRKSNQTLDTWVLDAMQI